jgi:hypothetical protein
LDHHCVQNVVVEKWRTRHVRQVQTFHENLGTLAVVSVIQYYKDLHNPSSPRSKDTLSPILGGEKGSWTLGSSKQQQTV